MAQDHQRREQHEAGEAGDANGGVARRQAPRPWRGAPAAVGDRCEGGRRDQPWQRHAAGAELNLARHHQPAVAPELPGTDVRGGVELLIREVGTVAVQALDCPRRQHAVVELGRDGRRGQRRRDRRCRARAETRCRRRQDVPERGHAAEPQQEEETLAIGQRRQDREREQSHERVSRHRRRSIAAEQAAGVKQETDQEDEQQDLRRAVENRDRGLHDDRAQEPREQQCDRHAVESPPAPCAGDVPHEDGRQSQHTGRRDQHEPAARPGPGQQVRVHEIEGVAQLAGLVGGEVVGVRIEDRRQKPALGKVVRDEDDAFLVDEATTAPEEHRVQREGDREQPDEPCACQPEPRAKRAGGEGWAHA